MSMREHVKKEVVGGVALAAVLGAIGLVPGTWGWVQEQVDFLEQPVAVSRWLHRSLFAFFIVVTCRAVVRKLADDAKPAFLKYVEDEFAGVRWRWAWTANNEYGNPVPYCLACDRRITPQPADAPHSQQTRYACVCGQAVTMPGSVQQINDGVIREVELKLRKDTWKRPAG